MTRLIRTEWLKMKKYTAFWWVMGLTALSYPGINYIFYSFYKTMTTQENTAGKLIKMAVGNPFAFPEAWQSVAYFSSWFVFIPAVVVIMLISNEYSFRTHRQNIIDGWGRGQFVTSKLIDVLIISLLITLLYLVVTMVTGYSNLADGTGDNWSKSYYAGLFALQTFSQLSIAFLIGFLIRKAFLALGIFIFYFLILENILVGVFRFKVQDIGRFLPFEISDRIIPVPAFLGKLETPEKYQNALDRIPLHVGLTVLFTLIIWAICYRVNSKRDLK
ncbi:MAG: ABC transporter permease [Sphingobacteriales bacterium]|nr:ABC transporter permease [Sphingobacteriales bacterium]